MEIVVRVGRSDSSMMKEPSAIVVRIFSASCQTATESRPPSAS